MGKFSWSTCSLKHHMITEFSRCPVLHRKCQTLNKHKMQMCEHGFPWERLFTWDDKPVINILLPELWEGAKGGARPINDWNRIFETCLKLEKCLCLHCTLSQAPPALAATWAAKRTWKDAKPPSGESVTTFFDFTFLTIRQQTPGTVWIPQRKHKMAEKLNF